MKRLAITFCFLALTTFIRSQAFSYTWAKGLGGTLADVATAIATDANGNVYTAGYFSGTIDLDPSAATYTLSSNGGIDLFISKLDASGNLVWAKSIGGINNDFAYGIAIDGSGNVITTGFFAGIVDFDPNASVSNLNSALASGVFVLKLDASGNFVWASAMYGNSYAYGQSVEVDATGNAYVAGLYSGVIDFDPGPSVSNLTVTGSSDLFVAKLDAAGSLVWVKSVGGSSLESANDIDVDALGNVYTTGHFNGTVDFDPGASSYTLSSQGANDVYISKWNSSGNFLWTVAFGSSTNDSGAGMDVDNLGNVYATGSFNGTVDFDPSVATYTLASNGNSDSFISKFSATGSFLWAHQIGGASNDLGTSLVLDAFKNVYTSGKFQGTVDFDPSVNSYTLASATAGSSDAFISKLDSLGNSAWAVGIGGSGNDVSNAITIGPLCAIHTGGSFASTADMDPSTATVSLVSAGNSDAYVHKMGQCIAPASPTNVTALANLTVCIGNTTTLSVASTATVNWYATLISTTSIASGTNYVTAFLGAGTYTYYAEAETCTLSAQRTPVSFSVIGCITGVTAYENEIRFMDVYPNPAHDQLHLKLNGVQTPVWVQVIDALGQTVKQFDVTETSSIIDTHELNNGLYFLKVKQDNQQHILKFIKH